LSLNQGGSITRSHHFPDDQALSALIKGRVEEGRATGIVLGVLDADGSQRIVAYGDPGPDAPSLGSDSVFEIGSITKVFTGILLADMAGRGEVDLTTPVQRYAPAGLTMPTRNGREITLTDLAAHRSGLPRLPGNLALDNLTTPYATYSVAQMYEFLAGYQLPRDIGSQFEYSNLGFGVLGHVLAARAGVEYESLLRNRILDPLGMSMTGIALSPAMKAQLAIGH
jgi:D-alanyl-D-alanine-carboxypeptidase/D-alanyl-D-alanine-endopeptidase